MDRLESSPKFGNVSDGNEQVVFMHAPRRNLFLVAKIGANAPVFVIHVGRPGFVGLAALVGKTGRLSRQRVAGPRFGAMIDARLNFDLGKARQP